MNHLPGPKLVPAPRFKSGQKVIAPNGQLRVVESMRFCQAMSRWVDGVEVETNYWGWALNTVDPVSGDKGLGYEEYYESAETGAV